MGEPTFTAAASTGIADLRRRVEGAPAWARAAIDAERQQRGLPLLFGQRAAPPSSKPRRPIGGIVRCLFGVAAPGLSNPHQLDGPGGHELLPEFISRSAWAGVKKALAAGQTIDFQRRHDGKPFATSRDAAVEIVIDPTLGLTFTLHPDAAAGFNWPAGGYCSIAFVGRTCRWTKVMLPGGRWARRIDSLTIRHIALLAPHDLPPAYRAAQFISCPPATLHRDRPAALSVARAAVAEDRLP